MVNGGHVNTARGMGKPLSAAETILGKAAGPTFIRKESRVAQAKEVQSQITKKDVPSAATTVTSQLYRKPSGIPTRATGGVKPGFGRGQEEDRLTKIRAAQKRDQSEKITNEIISQPGYKGEIPTDVYIGNIIQTLKSKDVALASFPGLNCHSMRTQPWTR
jgi:hypothetical protein